MPRGVFWRLTWRALAQNRTRTVVTLVGVTLACALLMAVLTTVTSLDRTMLDYVSASEGTWQAYVPAASDAATDAFMSDDRFPTLVASTELGSAILDDAARERLSAPSLTVLTMPATIKGAQDAADGMLIGAELTEGRFPETPDEIVLSVRLKGMTLVAGEEVRPSSIYGHEVVGLSGATSSGPLELGSQVTLELGCLVDEEGEPTCANDSRWHGSEDFDTPYARHLEGTTTHTYTVVGFRRSQEDYQGVYITTELYSSVALTAAGAEGTFGALPVARALWVTSDNPGRHAPFESFDEFDNALWHDLAMPSDEAEPDGPSVRMSMSSYVVHSNLLRYLGLSENRLVYDSFWELAVVLVTVIVGAAIVFVYTAFAIAGPERTRQFGLLASLGASRRQLRRMVLLEALMIAALAIPVGVGLGVVGVALALQATGEAFSVLMGTTQGMVLWVDPVVVAAVVAMMLLVMLVGAWVPAMRASCVSAIDAIRQPQEQRVSRRTARVAARGGLLRKGRGLPRLVARRNLSRASSRGWVVAVSLGVSFALFVTAGTIAQYLGELEGLTASLGSDFANDIVVDLFHGGSDTPASEAYDAQMADMVRELEAIEGTEVTERALMGEEQVVLPPELVGEELQWLFDHEDQAEGYELVEGLSATELPDGGVTVEVDHDLGEYLSSNASQLTSDGGWVGRATCYYVDDEVWDGLAREMGVSDAKLAALTTLDEDEPDASPALILGLHRSYLMSEDGQYLMAAIAPELAESRDVATAQVYADSGTEEAARWWSFLVAFDDGLMVYQGLREGETTADDPQEYGVDVVLYEEEPEEYAVEEGSSAGEALGSEPSTPSAESVASDVIAQDDDEGDGGDAVEENADADEEAGHLVPLADALGETLGDPMELQVVGALSYPLDVMTAMGDVFSYPVLVMPRRVLDAHGELSVYNALVAATMEDEAEAAAEVQRYTGALEDGWYGELFRPTNDMRQVRAIAWMLGLFSTLFSLVTMLIAVANAFNTLSSSLALREREFATLRSVGMGPRAFRRMIAWECVSYALRGLALGMAISLLANLAIRAAFELSIEGVGFAVPWGYVAASVVGVVVVLAVSVLFALRARRRTTTLVDSLRM